MKPVAVTPIGFRELGQIQLRRIWRPAKRAHLARCSIGGLIGDKSYWGQGLATELTQILVDYIFGELNLNKITAIIYSPNIGSIKCAERIGFQLEARIKDAGYFNGEYCEDLYYSMHQEEWRKQRKK